MNNRQRKKWLKKHNKYINPKDCWNLDVTIANFIIPRLKEFKKHNIGYPGHGEMDEFEKWDLALDKMIHAFELTLIDPVDKFWDGNKFTGTRKELEDYSEKINKEIQEGLHLFATYFQHLWW